MRCLFPVVLVVFCIGCGSNQKQAKDFRDDHKDNGVHIRARFIDGSAANYSTAGKGGMKSSKQHSADQFLYFDIQVERPGFEPDKKTADYLDFGMTNDFSIKMGTDSLPAAMVHRVANGKKDVYEYIVVFNRPDGSKLNTGFAGIVYDDKLFGLGRQVFEFGKQDILKLRQN